MQRIDVNHDWQFRSIDGGSWRPVALPHDAMIHEHRDPDTANGYNTGYYPGGTYEYRTTLRFEGRPPASCLLEFEGVYPHATVMVNDTLAGELAYGYGDYYLDIAALLKSGANTLTVVVDNSDIPNSRWYSGSGIYRPVWLWTAESADVIRPDGVHVKTSVVGDTTQAPNGLLADAHTNVNATVTIVLDNPPILGQYLSVTIIDAQGRIAAQFQEGDGTIEDAQLWSPDSPTLYTALIELHADDGTLLDTHTERFGIRTLTCDAVHGLRLNGRRTLLNGGCVHHDNGILGAATMPQAEFHRARILKQQGFNAVRSAHNPLSKAFLDACDEVGLLVMDEAFDMWWMHKTSYDYASDFRDHYADDLASMVRKDRNHPSVVLYSIGNEIADTKSPRAADAARSMRAIIRSLDTSRPIIDCVNPISLSIAAKTKAGIDQHDIKVEGEPGLNTTLEHASGPIMLSIIDRLMPAVLATGIIDRQTKAVFNEVDVAGFNYCRQGPEWLHRRHPNRVFCASETYPQEIIDTWPTAQRLPYMIGDFVWTGWDYIGEASVSAWAYSNPEPYGWMRQYGDHMALRGRLTGPYRRYPGLLGGSGLIDITGEPTGQMLYRQIVTGMRRTPAITVRPMQLLYGAGSSSSRAGRTARFIERGHDGISSWSWSGYEGREAIVQVYSGGRSVELSLNGHVVGRSPVRRCMAEFRVPYEPGTLTATAYDAGGRPIADSSLTSAGREFRVTTIFERVPNPYPRDDPRWNGDELVYESIALTDANGEVHVTDDRAITVLQDGSVLVDAPEGKPMDRRNRVDVSQSVSQHGGSGLGYSASTDAYSARHEGGVLSHVSNADAELNAVLAHATLLGVASANPITFDELAGNTCTTYFGRAQAIWRVEGRTYES